MKNAADYLKSHGLTNEVTPDIAELCDGPTPLLEIFCRSYACSGRNHKSYKGLKIMSGVRSVPFRCPLCGSKEFLHSKRINGL